MSASKPDPHTFSVLRFCFSVFLCRAASTSHKGPFEWERGCPGNPVIGFLCIHVRKTAKNSHIVDLQHDLAVYFLLYHPFIITLWLTKSPHRSTCRDGHSKVDDARDQDGQERPSGNRQLRVLEERQSGRSFHLHFILHPHHFVHVCVNMSVVGKKSSLTARSPEMLAPAKIPVAAGKKIENTEKKVWSRKAGPMFSIIMSPEDDGKRNSRTKHKQISW